MERVNLLIFGDVQGVGFRFTAIEVARDLGLVGWVKNNSDETVEILAEGSKDKLENLITWAKSGPSLAKVGKIKVEWGKATGEFSNFEARH